MITNAQSGTAVDEVAEAIYRIHTPIGDGFSFNQYLIADEHPLLFHTGPKSLLALVREAIAAVMPVEGLRFIAHSHFESDECGSINDLLAVAPRAEAVCGRINGMINADAYLRSPRALADGETLGLGAHEVRWFETPHLPHGWECGYLFESSTRTLLCGDLFTQPGAAASPLVESDILGPSEAFRKEMDYFSHAPNTREMLERLASCEPRTLACMHGSAWRGDAAALLRALGDSLSQ
jgi:flavorubredoxin